MRIMFRNSNTGIEKELAREDYKSHKVRNRVAVLAVALTTVLITVVFTAGLSLVETVTLAITASPGPGADGNYVMGDYETLERVKALPQVDWAAFARRCSNTYLHNREFSPVEVRLFAPDEVHYEKNMVNLINGHYPETAEEILLSETMSERLGLGEKTGIVYPLTVVVRENGADVEKEIPMTVCGYYVNPLKNIKDVYEEIYTSEGFIDTYNPELSKGRDTIYVKLNNLEFFKFGYDKEEKLEEVAELSGAEGKSYKMSNMSLLFLIPIFVIVFLIMCCGYFFIYNVFDISVANDIRFYGEVKTIGMSARQLKHMLHYQMNRIALWGILIGGIIGFGIGKVSSHVIIHLFAEGVAAYYQPPKFWSVFLLGAFFSWVTVAISTRKPFRIACRISPVEAARYGGKRKKGVFSILSFALGGMLFLTVYTLSVGFDVDEMVERHNATDFRISHNASMWQQEEPYQPMNREMIDRITALPYVEHTSVWLQARVEPNYYMDPDGEIRMYFSSMGEITREGKIGADIAAYNESLEERSRNRIEVNERGNYRLEIKGMDAEYLPCEEKYFDIIEGEMDAGKFAQGNYLIYQRPDGIGYSSGGKGAPYQVHAGDQVRVAFYDDAADRYVEKEFTILAIVSDHDPYSTSSLMKGNLILTNEVFQSIYTRYEDMIARFCFDTVKSEGKNGAANGVDMEEEKARYEEIQKIMEEDGNLQLFFESKYDDRLHYETEKKTMRILGLFLSGLVGVLGISNMVNTVATDLSARRLEYAAMQSIGMTRKQMERDIFGKYARYIFTAAGLAAVGGASLTYAFGQSLMLTGFSAGEFVQALVMFLGFSALLCAVLAHILTKVMNRKSVVERLREIV